MISASKPTITRREGLDTVVKEKTYLDQGPKEALVRLGGRATRVSNRRERKEKATER